MNDLISVKKDKGKIFSHLRNKWLIETPEESVRQEYLCILVNEYSFSLDQMSEEMEVTGRGSGQARADFVIWRTAEDKKNNKSPLIVVECKSDNVTIKPEDYSQGDNYARLTNSRFFVTHNNSETRYWRVFHDQMPKSYEEIENIPHADASDKEIEEIIAKLKVFKEDEFAKLLHECHNVIRNREKMDPAAAFDEIAKILFVKVFVERELKARKTRKNLFNVKYLDDQIGKYPLNDLFKKTKDFYSDDSIFKKDDEIKLRLSTGREIIKLLERYNLSDTSEDIKGIAFERFLGKTFRGEIGQFFTPRTIVEFMIRMVDPKEGDIICDPASGSGGFLIRFFEIVRQQILADADAQYKKYKAEIDKAEMEEEKRAEALLQKYNEIQVSIKPDVPESRLWKLANECIFGTDANDRMARTSKMNMIMHGDGHGGVHHHDGFLNVNGIFEERFDIILTNPPYGAIVDPSDVVHVAETPPELERKYISEYGNIYIESQERVKKAEGKPISSLFELPTSPTSKVKTEILFIERCLSLLKPGGRLGIVLPEGIFNNPSLEYVRTFCEDRAFIRAIISLPQETFYSSGASVKASLLFLQKFTLQEQEKFNQIKTISKLTIKEKYSYEYESNVERFEKEIENAKKSHALDKKKSLERELRNYRKKMEKKIQQESRLLLKQKFNYQIFLYEAKYVGITATGEEDRNELCRLPKYKLPDDLTKTCLELYCELL